MDRLTATYINEMVCRYEDCDVCEEYCPMMNVDNCECLKEAVKKLVSYEDAEEQGLLLRLLCKVGDTVYFLNRQGTYTEARIKQITLSNHLLYKCCYFAEPKEKKGCLYRYGNEDFGKLIFLTEEEAEAKLAEMRGE